MQIFIELVPHKSHQFTTIGHWFEDSAGVHIQISKELPWQYIAAVMFHELIEFFICKSKGVTTAECDAFDALFEKEYERGIWPKSVEAGFDKRCPYRKGHIWGTRFERIVIFLLGSNWKAYNEACGKLMGI